MKDLVIKEKTNQISNKDSLIKLFATLLVILSGVILFADKISTFGITETFGFKNPKTFIWVFSQSLGPLLLCLGAILKPYRVFYFVPMYLYFIQVYWVFDPSTYKLDDPLLHVYAIGFCIGTLMFLMLAVIVAQELTRTNEILIKNLRKLTRHIGVTIRNKYVNEEDSKDYTIDTVDIIDSLD